MKTWYHDMNGRQAYYREGNWIFDPDGMPTFYVSKGCWFADGKIAFQLKDSWMMSVDGKASFYPE